MSFEILDKDNNSMYIRFTNKYDKEIKFFIKMYTDKLPAKKRNRKQTRRKQKRT